MDNTTLRTVLTEIKEQNKRDYKNREVEGQGTIRSLYDFVSQEYWQLGTTNTEIIDNLKELFLNMNYAIYYYLKDYTNGMDKMADIENMMIDDFIERNCEE